MQVIGRECSSWVEILCDVQCEACTLELKSLSLTRSRTQSPIKSLLITILVSLLVYYWWQEFVLNFISRSCLKQFK